MPSRSIQERLQDILTEIEDIQQMVSQLSFEEFCEDRRTMKAVLYSLAVIGEAAASLFPEVSELYPQIPWRQMRGMRNITVHEYFQVDLTIIWATIQSDLPPLYAALKEIV
ncbi:MAG: DUF86 domain-containing protein [Synechococcaceae cyanobacterium SM2_3_2]|nr:DUF86 domain-containing protein [Synechococcaceae cyanobacterium SM2_3_2]